MNYTLVIAYKAVGYKKDLQTLPSVTSRTARSSNNSKYRPRNIATINHNIGNVSIVPSVSQTIGAHVQRSCIIVTLPKKLNKKPTNAKAEANPRAKARWS